VIASALQRMLLYQQEFGLTQLRVYTTVFMAWMGAVLIWYALTVLAGRRPRFAFGAVAAGYLSLLVLLALNPDDLIVRTNIARASEGKRIDARYLSTLSDDAVPALLEGLDRLDAPGQTIVAKDLLRRKHRLEQLDWRSWNLSRAAALRALEAQEGVLIGKQEEQQTPNNQ
jgi:hypothetical protein